MAGDNKTVVERLAEIEEQIEQYQRNSGIPLALPPGTEETMSTPGAARSTN